MGLRRLACALALPSFAFSLVAGCGSDASTSASTDTDGGAVAHGDSGASGGGDASLVCGTCPTGYTCGSANGVAVCRAPSGVPLFSHVFVIPMENTSLSTLDAATNTPNFKAIKAAWASGTDYHGVAHPSLPNYVAMVSGDTQGIGCDCNPSGSACNTVTCNEILGSCGCDQSAPSLADQIEAAGKTWKSFAEDIGTPCNLTSSGKYAARHVPFLYFDGVQKDAARCANVTDFAGFDPASAPTFAFLTPNLDDDMHDPLPASAKNLANGDAWIKPIVDRITASSAWKDRGLLVIVWDEDDASADAPIPIFVISPLAKSGGFTSTTRADHYALLATFEDGLGLSRLGKAAQATPLVDYFPAQ